MRTAAVGSLLVWALAVLVTAEVKDGSRGPAFSCRGRSPGYYADLETNCQDYHMCDAGGRRYTYSCPNQTRFQQRVMICDHWFMVDCSLSESHFDANLLIGQQDKQFVEPFNRLPSPSQPAYEAKKSFLPSPTKKILDEKNASVKYTETKFPTPTGSTKPTIGKSLPREYADNPFFGSLTRTPSAAAGQGDRDSSTFQQRKDQAVSSNARKPGATSAPSPSTPTFRQATPLSPPTRGQATPIAFPNREQRRTTTVVPSSRDYGFVTREGHLTEPPRLFRNDFSKVVEITSFGVFTTQPPSSTRYESLKTRVGVDVRAPHPATRAPPTPSPLPITRAPPTPSSLPVTRAPPTPSPLPITQAPPTSSRLPTTRLPLTFPTFPTTRAPPSPSTQSNRTQGSLFEGSLRAPNETQWPTGLHRTPGGFRYVTQDAAQSSNRRPTAFGVQGLSGVSTGTGFATGSEPRRGERLPTASDVLTGKDFPTASDISTGKWFPTGPDASVGKETPTRADASSGKWFPTRTDVPTGKEFPTGPDVSTGKWFPTGSGVSTGKEFPTRADVSTGIWFPTRTDVLTREGLSTGLDVSFGSAFPSGSDDSTGSDLSLGDRFPSGGGADVSFEEEEEDLNTVEVRIPDPRRMFFIPDSAAREAEMLSSNNETVLRIPLPSSRHHGPMRFKGVRGTKGRRPDCPQCHPAFLQPNSCQPCVLIRR